MSFYVFHGSSEKHIQQNYDFPNWKCTGSGYAIPFYVSPNRKLFSAGESKYPMKLSFEGDSNTKKHAQEYVRTIFEGLVRKGEIQYYLLQESPTPPDLIMDSPPTFQ